MLARNLSDASRPNGHSQDCFPGISQGENCPAPVPKKLVLCGKASERGGHVVNVFIGQKNGVPLMRGKLLFDIAKHPCDIDVGGTLDDNSTEKVLPFRSGRRGSLGFSRRLSLSSRRLNERSYVLDLIFGDSGAILARQEIIACRYVGGVPYGLPASGPLRRCRCLRRFLQHYYFRNLH